MQEDDLERRFIYHSPDEVKASEHQQVRSVSLYVARVLNGILPEGREKSLVITHLEEAMFWANAAIARS